MFRAVTCSSSGGQIVLLQHLVLSFSVNGRTVRRYRRTVRPFTESDDTRWYDIYLLTAIGLSPGGSSTVHIYTQTVQYSTHLHTNSTVQYSTAQYTVYIVFPLQQCLYEIASILHYTYSISPVLLVIDCSTDTAVLVYCLNRPILSSAAFHSYIYRMSQEESARLQEGVPYVKVYRYNPKHLYPKLNGYGDNGQRILKLWQLLHTFWWPNTY